MKNTKGNTMIEINMKVDYATPVLNLIKVRSAAPHPIDRYVSLETRLREFRTIALDLGRQTGKTTSAVKIAKALGHKAAIFTHNGTMARAVRESHPDVADVCYSAPKNIFDYMNTSHVITNVEHIILDECTNEDYETLVAQLVECECDVKTIVRLGIIPS